ncbi:MAG: serine/threonine-protein kinase [Gemmatimonadota bacterium]
MPELLVSNPFASLTRMDVLRELNTGLAGRYVIDREIGAGGMATVYLAEDLEHHRTVALKVLRPELAAAFGKDRFLAEISVTANLQYPHLLPLFDSGEADNLLYYVMPFVDGESLRQRLERDPQLPVDDTIRIAIAVAGALDYAHRHGVVHRDLKPENILLQDREPVVSDFGIALAVSKAAGERITQTGFSLGTPQYMSPEQATADSPIDARSDVYSLAAVIYELLTGEPPHSGRTAQQIIARKLTETARPIRDTRPNVDARVEAAIAKGLEKLPADRWKTAHDFAEALCGSPPTVTGSKNRARAKRMSLAAAVLALPALSGWTLWRRQALDPVALNRSTVAVLPFRVSGADPAVRYLGEGMTDLLGTLLTGEGGPRALESGRTPCLPGVVAAGQPSARAHPRQFRGSAAASAPVS